MTTKYIFRYALAASLAVSAASCKKSLDLQPISDATVNNSYNTATQAEAALQAHTIHLHHQIITSGIIFLLAM
jgi:hypothetical protein